MENFLAGRATVAKLKPAGIKPVPEIGGFSPLFEKKAQPVVVAPTSPTPPASPPDQVDVAPVAAVASAPASTPHAHKVSVEIVRADGVVHGIVVTCKCGERIELDCVY